MLHYLCVCIRERKKGDKVEETAWGKDKTLQLRELDKKKENLPFFQRAWQPPLLCSLELFVVGVITRGPGQREILFV